MDKPKSVGEITAALGLIKRRLRARSTATWNEPMAVRRGLTTNHKRVGFQMTNSPTLEASRQAVATGPQPHRFAQLGSRRHVVVES